MKRGSRQYVKRLDENVRSMDESYVCHFRWSDDGWIWNGHEIISRDEMDEL